MDAERGTAESTQGLSAERIGRNDAIFRDANEAIRQTAETYGFDDKVPFVCECADPNCREILRLTLAEYSEVRRDPRHFVNAPGHETAAREWGEVVARADGYVTVAKLGPAAEVAERLEGEPGEAAERSEGEPGEAEARGDPCRTAPG